MDVFHVLLGRTFVVGLHTKNKTLFKKLGFPALTVIPLSVHDLTRFYVDAIS